MNFDLNFCGMLDASVSVIVVIYCFPYFFFLKFLEGSMGLVHGYAVRPSSKLRWGSARVVLA